MTGGRGSSTLFLSRVSSYGSIGLLILSLIFIHIFLTGSICLLILAAWLEKNNFIIKTAKQNHSFNILYVSRVEGIIPSLCVLLISLAVFYNRVSLGNDAIIILTVMLIPLALLLGLFEWPCCRSESWFLFMRCISPLGIQITDNKMESNLFLSRSFYTVLGTAEISPDIVLSESSSNSIKK